MEFTHLDENGKVKMVDISDKQVTVRKAVAAGEIKCNRNTVSLIISNEIKKGDVFAAARIAGIMAAKKTSEIIPLCHNISIQSVEINIDADSEQGKIFIKSIVITDGKTGVEMEALTAVTGSCLCIYDMCKAVDKDMVIGDIKLLSKSGGRSGNYERV
jgi:cyclic pyranopterin monophosphate synthase